jgi:hypothetical protein
MVQKHLERGTLEPASTAAAPPDPAAPAATAATSAATARRRRANATTTTPSSATPPGTPTSTGAGRRRGKSEPAATSPTSKPYVLPSNNSTPSWLITPKNVRQFASQANHIATLVLRGEVDIERARLYSGLARTIAQAMSVEVTRARFLSQIPDLTFEDDDG